jgi:hypothetical protein
MFLSLHQTKLSFVNVCYMEKRQRKQCEVSWTPVYHCHHFMAGLDTLILVCGFHDINLQMDVWLQELSKYAGNNCKPLYMYCFVHCNLILVFFLTITNIISHFVITFLQSIYSYYLRQTCLWLCTIASVPWLQFMIHVMLFPIINGFKFYISTFTLLLLLYYHHRWW